MRSWMAYSIEVSVGGFIMAIVFNIVQIFGMAGLMHLGGYLCFILIPLSSKYHYFSSHNFNSWHSVNRWSYELWSNAHLIHRPSHLSALICNLSTYIIKTVLLHYPSGAVAAHYKGLTQLLIEFIRSVLLCPSLFKNTMWISLHAIGLKSHTSHTSPVFSVSKTFQSLRCALGKVWSGPRHRSTCSSRKVQATAATTQGQAACKRISRGHNEGRIRGPSLKYQSIIHEDVYILSRSRSALAFAGRYLIWPSASNCSLSSSAFTKEIWKLYFQLLRDRLDAKKCCCRCSSDPWFWFQRGWEDMSGLFHTIPFWNMCFSVSSNGRISYADLTCVQYLWNQYLLWYRSIRYHEHRRWNGGSHSISSILIRDT